MKIASSSFDRRIVYWLMEAFLEDKETKRNRAIDQLDSMIPQIQSLINSARR